MLLPEAVFCGYFLCDVLADDPDEVVYAQVVGQAEDLLQKLFFKVNGVGVDRSDDQFTRCRGYQVKSDEAWKYRRVSNHTMLNISW